MIRFKNYLLYFLILVYVSGAIGFNISPDFFAPFTPFTLLLTCVVFLISQPLLNTRYVIAFFTMALLGYGIEVLGVRTGIVFGEYSYGDALGIKLLDVPLIISLNWAMMISGGLSISKQLFENKLSILISTAIITTTTDLLIEQVAYRLDFWEFVGGMPGWHNYMGWMATSFVLAWIFYPYLSKGNYRTGLTIIGLQLLFFGTIYVLNAIHDMEILLNLGIVLVTFILTEFSAWANHTYIMHGVLWYFHADHHKKDHDGWFERNDFFFIMYAVPSWLLIMFGMMNGYAWYTWVGFGIAAYGLAYFLVHDIIIHQRFKLFSKSNNLYVLALRRAHKMHHKHIGKEHGESFGMLIIKPKYFSEAAKLKENQNK